MNIEANLRYFNPKVNFTVLFLAVFGFAMLAIGYGQMSVLFMVVGGLLIMLGIYQFFWNRTHKITGAQLDQSAKAMADKLPLKKNALAALCLDAEDVVDWTGIILAGYCTTGIRTEPLFRKDEADGRLRSSNYQVTVFWFAPKKLYVYTVVKSLVDKENLEQGHMWRYGSIKYLDFATQDFTYTSGGDEKRETTQVSFLRLKDTKGGSYAFAFEGSSDAALKVERLRKLVQERSAQPDLDARDDDDPEEGEGRQRRKGGDGAPVLRAKSPRSRKKK